MANNYDFKQLSKEIHHPAYKTKAADFRHVKTEFVNQIWTADLIDMNSVVKYNDRFSYILVVLDIASRYAWAVPLVNKDAKTVLDAFNKIFAEAGAKPKLIWSDSGKEFYNKLAQKQFDKDGIKIYSTFGPHKASIIERFNRTLKGWMFKAFTANNDKTWINILPNLIKKYNDKFHKGINAIPAKVYALEDNPHYNFPDENPKKMKQKFKVGDFVRVSKTKMIFEKGYTANWTIEVFKVIEVLPTTPPTYKLEDLQGKDITGSFYGNELLKTKMTENIYLINEVLKERKKGNKKEYFVSWLGYPKSANSWVGQDDIDDV